jgi:hypothetical protein
MSNFETYITEPTFWQENDGSPKSRDTQIKILNELDSNFNSLPLQSKHEVIDTYKDKVKVNPVISTGKVTSGVNDEIPTFTDEVPSLIGGIAGGLMGKTVPSRIIKSGVVGGGGEAAYQLYQQATDAPLKPKTTQEAGQRIAQAMVSEGAGQGIGEGLTRVGAKLIPRVLPKYMESGLEAPGQELKQYMRPYEDKPGFVRNTLGIPAKEKATFTLGQQADQLSGVVKLESIIENSMFGGQSIKNLKRVQEEAVQDYTHATVGKIWGDIASVAPSEQGRFLVDAIIKNTDDFHKIGGQFYTKIDELVALQSEKRGYFTKGIVDTTPLYQLATQLDKSVTSRAGLGSSEAGDIFVKKARKLRTDMDFSEAHELRSALLSEQRKMEPGEKANFIINKMVTTIDQQMEKAARKMSPEIYEAWRRADSIWKTGEEQFENKFIKGIVDTAVEKGQPELIGKQILQNTEIGQINKVKSALGFDVSNNSWKNAEGKKSFQAIKAGWFEELVGKSTKMNAGEIQETTVGNSVYENLRKMGGKGKNWWEGESIKTMFTPQEILLLKNFETATRVSQKKPAGGSGSMLIQLMQAKPLVDVATLLAGGGLIGGGAYLDNPEAIAGGIAVLATPKILGNMLVKPKYQKLFIDGLNVNKPLSWPILSKLITGAIETQVELGRYNKFMPEQNPTQPKYTNKILPTQ